MEVIYTGIRQSPEQIVETALQEDVDVIGLSILSGAHMSIIPRILELLNESGIGDIPVIVGGIIPPDDVEELKRRGVKAIFGPGSSVNEIVEFIKSIT
jgi:methylmalonyl-CoA mutase C-terminal domain/subunit